MLLEAYGIGLHLSGCIYPGVVGKLNAHQPYLKDFLAPDKDILAAFVYFQLHGAPTILDRSLIDP